MLEYDFTLKFNLPDSRLDPTDRLERLAAEGCDDALIGVGKRGKLALHFIRESTDAKEAVYSAIQDVQRAIPQAVLQEVGPDFIGLTEVANTIFQKQ